MIDFFIEKLPEIEDCNFFVPQKMGEEVCTVHRTLYNMSVTVLNGIILAHAHYYIL